MSLIILIPVLAFVAHQILFAGVEAPPKDFGSGCMFDMIAGRYDAINRVLALGMDTQWRKEMVRVIEASVKDTPEPVILDLATGTADVSLLLAETIPNANIIGVDPSNNMLEVGRQKIVKKRFQDRISLELEDAMDLSSREAKSFDAATMSFGIRNVPDRSKAVCEIHRVLKPSSLFCILEFSEPDDSFGVLGAAARLFIRHVIPYLGGILSGKPREYWHLQNSIKDFPAPQEFSKQIESTQCSTGSFTLEKIQQMNFGSVQLYVLRTDPAPTTISNEQDAKVES